MRFVTTPVFDRDFKRLAREHQDLFKRKAFPPFHDAAVRAAAGEADPWGRGLRVRRVQGTSFIWEMSWSFTNPDGRATWAWTTIDGEAAVQWRRVGSHAVFDAP